MHVQGSVVLVRVHVATMSQGPDGRIESTVWLSVFERISGGVEPCDVGPVTGLFSSVLKRKKCSGVF